MYRRDRKAIQSTRSIDHHFNQVSDLVVVDPVIPSAKLKAPTPTLDIWRVFRPTAHCFAALKKPSPDI
jgi:hypothetical protein